MTVAHRVMPSAQFTRHMPRAKQPGTAAGIEAAILFYDWASQHGDRLCWQHIADRYQVSRATAYRWLRAFLDVRARIGDRMPGEPR